MRHRMRTLPATVLTAVLVAVGLAAPAPAYGAAAASAPVPAQQPADPDETVSCEVDYQIVAEWGNGFQAQVTVTNTGTVPVFWEVVIVWDGTQILQAWNVTVTQSGNTWLFQPPPPWNGWLQPLLPGQSVSFGLLGTGPRHPESIEVNCWAA